MSTASLIEAVDAGIASEEAHVGLSTGDDVTLSVHSDDGHAMGIAFLSTSTARKLAAELLRAADVTEAQDKLRVRRDRLRAQADRLAAQQAALLARLAELS